MPRTAVRSSLILTLLLTLFAVPGLAHAQEKPAASRAKVAEVGDQRLSIDFPGGSVLEYFQALQAARPTSNYAMHPDTGLVRMPPVKFGGVFEEVACRAPLGLIRGVIVDTSFLSSEDKTSFTCLVRISREDVQDWLRPIEPTTDVDFTGGKLSDYVARLRETGANIVVSPAEVGESVLPPIKLTRARVHDAVKALESVQWSDGTTRLGTSQEGGIAIIGWRTPRQEGGGPPQMSMVWNLREITDSGAKAEDALSAVETALAMVKDTADVKFHKETSLLMARGTPEQINTIDQVVSRLRDDAHRAGTRNVR